MRYIKIQQKFCCFIGHRKINLTTELVLRLKEFIEYLILAEGVNCFLFGSRSEFNSLCHSIVFELKSKYPHIKMIFYTCKGEAFVSHSERERAQSLLTKITKSQEKILSYDEEVEHKSKYSAGRASYVERNQAMIDASTICVFYYDENTNLKSSGTKIAYEYAKRKNKQINNVFYR